MLLILFFQCISLISMKCTDNFSVPEIRNAFLRFFTSLLNNYHEFVNDDLNCDLFRTEDFLSERNYAPSKREWLEKLLKTQMFQRFLEERGDDPNSASVLFFDESIAAKNNRSTKTSLKKGRKTTPFLDDTWWKVSKMNLIFALLGVYAADLARRFRILSRHRLHPTGVCLLMGGYTPTLNFQFLTIHCLAQ